MLRPRMGLHFLLMAAKNRAIGRSGRPDGTSKGCSPHVSPGCISVVVPMPESHDFHTVPAEDTVSYKVLPDGKLEAALFAKDGHQLEMAQIAQANGSVAESLPEAFFRKHLLDIGD